MNGLGKNGHQNRCGGPGDHMHKRNFNKSIAKLSKYFSAKVAADIELVGGSEDHPSQGSKYQRHTVIKDLFKFQIRSFSLQASEGEPFKEVGQDQNEERTGDPSIDRKKVVSGEKDHRKDDTDQHQNPGQGTVYGYIHRLSVGGKYAIDPQGGEKQHGYG
jgi:hypothetical protein